MQTSENLPLVHDGLHRSLGENSGFAHIFHGEQLGVLGFLSLDFPHLAESAFSNTEVLLEMRLADGCMRVRIQIFSDNSVRDERKI